MKKKQVLPAFFKIGTTGLVAILLGIFVGTQISNYYFAVNNYLTYSKEELQDDISAIRYEGKTPDQLSATDAYNVAIKKLQDQHSYEIISLGDLGTSLGVTQKAYSKCTKKGEQYYQEIATYSSVIKQASRYSYKIGEDINYQHGSLSSDDLTNIAWQDKFDYYTYEEYSSLLGREPIEQSTYIISSRTATETSPCKLDNGQYTYSITLNAPLSTICYVKEIGFVSGISYKTVEFLELRINFTLDKDFNFISQTNYEKYTLSYSGIKVTITGNYEISYTY